MAVLAAPHVRKAWRFDPSDSGNQSYYSVAPAKRLEYGAYYLGLCAFLALMSYDLHEMLQQLHAQR